MIFFLHSWLAECYSGDGGLETYSRDGPTRQCFNSKYQPCDSTCEEEPCTGTKNTMFVYQLGKREYEEIGWSWAIFVEMLQIVLQVESAVNRLNTTRFPRYNVTASDFSLFPFLYFKYYSYFQVLNVNLVLLASKTSKSCSTPKKTSALTSQTRKPTQTSQPKTATPTRKRTRQSTKRKYLELQYNMVQMIAARYINNTKK